MLHMLSKPSSALLFCLPVLHISSRNVVENDAMFFPVILLPLKVILDCVAFANSGVVRVKPRQQHCRR